MLGDRHQMSAANSAAHSPTRWKQSSRVLWNLRREVFTRFNRSLSIEL